MKEDTLNKQENLMNSNKQSSPTIKNTLILEKPPYNISKPTSISDGVELMREKQNHGEFVIMKGIGCRQIE